MLALTDASTTAAALVLTTPRRHGPPRLPMSELKPRGSALRSRRFRERRAAVKRGELPEAYWPNGRPRTAPLCDLTRQGKKYRRDHPLAAACALLQLAQPPGESRPAELEHMAPLLLEFHPDQDDRRQEEEEEEEEEEEAQEVAARAAAEARTQAKMDREVRRLDDCDRDGGRTTGRRSTAVRLDTTRHIAKPDMTCGICMEDVGSLVEQGHKIQRMTCCRAFFCKPCLTSWTSASEDMVSTGYDDHASTVPVDPLREVSASRAMGDGTIEMANGRLAWTGRGYVSAGGQECEVWMNRHACPQCRKVFKVSDCHKVTVAFSADHVRCYRRT
jgi:hypothetical protein